MINRYCADFYYLLVNLVKNNRFISYNTSSAPETTRAHDDSNEQTRLLLQLLLHKHRTIIYIVFVMFIVDKLRRCFLPRTASCTIIIIIIKKNGACGYTVAAARGRSGGVARLTDNGTGLGLPGFHYQRVSFVF